MGSEFTQQRVDLIVAISRTVLTPTMIPVFWVLFLCFFSIWNFEEWSTEISHKMYELGWNSFYSLPPNCQIVQYAQINPLSYQENNDINHTIKYLTLAACLNSTDGKYQTR